MAAHARLHQPAPIEEDIGDIYDMGLQIPQEVSGWVQCHCTVHEKCKEFKGMHLWQMALRVCDCT